jgi:hypothetical protein
MVISNGLAKNSKTNENVKKIVAPVYNDQRMTIRMKAEVLEMDKASVHQIFTVNLKIKEVCAKMVPKNLTNG